MLMKSYISYIDLIPYLVAQVHVLRISDNRGVNIKYLLILHPDTEHTYKCLSQCFSSENRISLANDAISLPNVPSGQQFYIGRNYVNFYLFI